MMCVQLLVLVGTAAGLLTVPPVSSTTDHQEEVTVKAGEDAMLPCQAQTGASITMIKWNRSDLESDKYVFFFRENRPRENYQLPSFHGRVELKDPQMTEGDASVVLKNVTANDSGIYECVVSTSSGGGRRKRVAPFRHIVHLTVEDSGPKAGGNKDKVSKDEGNKDKYSAVLLGFSVLLLLVF
ncbi:nectin-4-like [Sparus aurata]|uniref:nectin-4-like n=1 Tax=Sparus aurata TaxID=8175 RepID=UPI0011C155AF|nr:nectin-4-like [Sparus aurata]